MSSELSGLDTPGWVTSVLDLFEKAKFFDESDVAAQISTAAKNVESPTPIEKKAADSERWAFYFLLLPDGEMTEWKTHFGPIFVSGDFRNPDIDWIDEAIIRYWEKRMTVAKHPLLRARYADLVWDFSKPACKLKPPVEAARSAVDEYVAASLLADAKSAIPTSDRLQRALKIALGIGDQTRVEQVRDAMAELFTRVNETWGWVKLFDTFAEHAKVQLTVAQQDAMVAGLEMHVAEAAGKPEGVDPAGTFHVAARLVRHYQSVDRLPDAKRVVLVCGQSAERHAAAADHTRAYFWLDHVFQLYRANGLEADAERVQLQARRQGELARYEAIPISADIDLPPEELEGFLTDVTEGGLDTALQTIAGHFVPHLNRIRENLRELRRDYPMATMWPITKMSEGQMVAQIGSVDTDPDGALVNGVVEDIRHRRFFLKQALDRLRERYSVTPDQVVDFVQQSPMFTLRFRNIIQQGVEAYFVGDHSKAISLLVPQIENGLRLFLNLLGRPPNKPKRGGQPGMMEKSLTDILEYEPLIKEKLGEDVHLYLVAFLADARGMNIRNRMCHGLMVAEDFNHWISDRVLHMILLLGTCRPKKSEELLNLPEANGYR